MRVVSLFNHSRKETKKKKKTMKGKDWFYGIEEILANGINGKIDDFVYKL